MVASLPRGVGLRSEHLSIMRAMGPSTSWDPWPRPAHEQPWGQRSVHRSAKMTSRSRFWSLVYTVTLLWIDVGTQECTQIGGDCLSALFWGIRVHCCDASCVGWPEWLNRHGVPAAPPSVAASPLVRKTGSARVAPPLGWRFHRGINPHESPKSPFKKARAMTPERYVGPTHPPRRCCAWTSP